MQSYELIFQSKKSATNYKCLVHGDTIFSTDVINTNYDYFSDLCLKGCKNYNRKWSCPPFSPEYHVFANEYNYLTVFLLCMRMDQFNHIKNAYTKIKAANTMMKSRIDRLLRAQSDNGRMISTGSCRLCKSCKLISKTVCNHPDKMAYSFEALGVNVGVLARAVFDHELLWYSKGNLPEYTTVVAGLLSNSPSDVKRLILALEN